MPLDEAARARALDDYVAAADTAVLECRAGRHRFADITDASARARKRRKITRQRSGVFLAELACLRGCGVAMIKVYGEDGVTQRSRAIYDYDGTGDRYLFPKGSRVGRLDRFDLGAVRLELLRRAAEDGLVADQEDE